MREQGFSGYSLKGCKRDLAFAPFPVSAPLYFDSFTPLYRGFPVSVRLCPYLAPFQSIAPRSYPFGGITLYRGIGWLPIYSPFAGLSFLRAMLVPLALFGVPYCDLLGLSACSYLVNNFYLFFLYDSIFLLSLVLTNKFIE